MKQLFTLVAFFMMMLLVTTSCTTADSSEVALVVDQIGNDKGVPNIEMASGFIFYFPQHKTCICIQHRYSIRYGQLH